MNQPSVIIAALKGRKVPRGVLGGTKRGTAVLNG